MKRCKQRGALHLALSVCLLASILLTGCASSPTVSVEEHVGNRSLQWAAALMALDYDEALTFMTPSYRNSPRVERFRADFSGAGYWQDVEVKWVKCDQDTAAADASADASAPPANPDPYEVTNTPGDADACVVNVWNDCNKSFSGPIDVSTTVSTHSDRCEVRLMLTVMKPPEMSFPMPIPYELTWLNVNGGWYIYRK